MWVFKHDGVLKCMLSALDVDLDFGTTVPFCPTITILAGIAVKHDKIKKTFDFTVTRNIVDFPKKKSQLKDLLTIAAMSMDTDLAVQDTWELRENHPIDTLRWPNVSKLQYIVFQNIDAIENTMIECLLCEIHTLYDGRQYIVPRFALLKTNTGSLKLSEIVYTQEEHQLQNTTVTYCTITDPITQKSITVTLTYPLYPEK